MDQRRELLAVAVSRVVLVPWPGDNHPSRIPGARRQLRIEWARSVLDRPQAAVVAQPIREPGTRRPTSDGRSEAMRELEVTWRRAAADKRSETMRSYYRDAFEPKLVGSGPRCSLP